MGDQVNLIAANYLHLIDMAKNKTVLQTLGFFSKEL